MWLFPAPYPGTIIPLNLPSLGGRVIVQKDAFLCAALGTKNFDHLQPKNWVPDFFGGEGIYSSATGR